MSYAIRSKDNGSFYVGAAFIGPRFGGDLGNAHRFESRVEAGMAALTFPLTVLFDVVEIHDIACKDCQGTMHIEGEIPRLPEARMCQCAMCDRWHTASFTSRGKIITARVDMLKADAPRPEAG